MDKICVVCGNSFIAFGNTKTCCQEHSLLLRQKRKICSYCGQPFVAELKTGRFSKHKKFCSKDCAKKQAKKNENEARREKYATDENYRLTILTKHSEYSRSEQGKKVIQGHKLARDERIKNTTEVDSHINLKELYERDNGICWICGKSCDWNDKELRISESGHNYLATFGDYPSIDHVIPLSKYGTHTWDNIRLAHKRCNIKKSNKI